MYISLKTKQTKQTNNKILIKI